MYLASKTSPLTLTLIRSTHTLATGCAVWPVAMLVLDNRVSATGAIAGAVVGNIGSVLFAMTNTPYVHMPALPATYCYLLLPTVLPTVLPTATYCYLLLTTCYLQPTAYYR
jgi:hypothetical protein